MPHSAAGAWVRTVTKVPDAAPWCGAWVGHWCAPAGGIAGEGATAVDGTSVRPSRATLVAMGAGGYGPRSRDGSGLGGSNVSSRHWAPPLGWTGRGAAG